MDSLGLNTFSQLAPPTATQSRADATPERTSPKPGGSFGDVLAARAGKPAPKASSRVASPFDEVVTETPPETDVSAAPVATDHEDAWGDFLTKMNDELGLSAEDVLKAFEKLSDEELAQKPEDTTEQMVAALGLTGQPAALAKQYFKELIARTDQPKADVAAAPAPAEAHRSIERALERMDAHLMMNSPTVRASSVPDARSATFATASTEDQPAIDAKSAETNSGPTKPVDSPAGDSTMNDALLAQMTPVTEQKSEPKVDRLVREMLERSPETPAAPAPTMNDAPAAPATSLISQFANRVEMNTDADATVVDDQAAPVSAKPTAADFVFASARRSDDDTADSDTSSDDFAEDLNLGRETGPTGTAHQAPKPDFADTLAPKGATAAANGPGLAPEIVDTARLMVKNGGGEMQVTLNTEGLGEIAMKVNVRDGKVSVEMLTETQEAKRMLEHQLNDLKSQLISSNLQIDKIHVDTNSNLSRQNEQGQQDAQRQAAREQSWSQGQFNSQGGNQSQQQQARRQAYDAPAGRAYGAPIGAAARSGAMPPPPRTANSRRLNLVA